MTGTSRRDFLLLRPGSRGRVVEIDCRRLFMRLLDAELTVPQEGEAADAAPDHFQYGEPPARFEARTLDGLFDALAQELADAARVRLVDPEWFDGSRFEERFQRVIDVFSARGGVLESNRED